MNISSFDRIGHCIKKTGNYGMQNRYTSLLGNSLLEPTGVEMKIKTWAIIADIVHHL